MGVGKIESKHHILSILTKNEKKVIEFQLGKPITKKKKKKKKQKKTKKKKTKNKKQKRVSTWKGRSKGLHFFGYGR